MPDRQAALQVCKGYQIIPMIYTYKYTHLYVYTSIYAIYIYMYTYAYTHTHTHTHTRTHPYTQASIHPCMHACMHAHVSISQPSSCMFVRLCCYLWSVCTDRDQGCSTDRGGGANGFRSVDLSFRSQHSGLSFYISFGNPSKGNS